MFPPFDADVDAPVDRWAVRLDEPAALRPDPFASAPDAPRDDATFPLFTLDVPTIEFQPRLSRFGEAA